MRERRQNKIIRTQYDLLKNCLYDCKGQEYGCELYTPCKKYSSCVWYEIIKKDVIKIKDKEGYVTFGLLEKILEDNCKIKI